MGIVVLTSLNVWPEHVLYATQPITQDVNAATVASTVSVKRSWPVQMDVKMRAKPILTVVASACPVAQAARVRTTMIATLAAA